METTFSPKSLGEAGLASDVRALMAVVRREWTIFRRYPSWIIALFIWPLIFPMMYILTARALAGPDGSGLAVFSQTTGATDFIGYIVIGTTVWMWQNIVLWDVGFSLRNEQMRGTLESNWLSPTSIDSPGARSKGRPVRRSFRCLCSSASPPWSSGCSSASGSMAVSG